MFNSPLLTNAEAAAYLKMSPRTLDRWRCAQRGPAFKKIGGSVRYTIADLNGFAQMGEVA